VSLERLKQRIGAGGTVDLDSAFEEFRSASGSTDLDQFLLYLRSKDLISAELFRDLHADDEVTVTRLVAVTSDKTLILEPAAQSPTNGAPARGRQIAPGELRYSMLGSIGRGAMGEVHVARDEELLRKVAYKRMLPNVMSSAPHAARFFSEAQVTAQLDHPHIVPIYGVEVGADGGLGYSMKLVQGKTLSQVIVEARDSAAEAEARQVGRLDLFLKVCDAMSFAHSKGVLHRDLKPDNIMVGRYNEVYVMDWGICRVRGAADPGADSVTVSREPASPDDRTQLGAVMGTPVFMSPEQAHGRNAELDGRSDLYTLGLILFEIVTLQRARRGNGMHEVLAKAGSGELEPMVHVNSHVRVPRELKAIVAKATAVAPDDRYSSVAAFAEDLRRYLRGEAVAAAPDNWLQSAARSVGRHRQAALVAMAALLLIGASGVIVSLAHERTALERAGRNERAMEAFLSTVQGQTHIIDDRFFRDERILTELASRAEEALSSADPKLEARRYFSEDFDTPGRQPPDLAWSEFYRRPISLQWPVLKLAPGVERKAVDRDVRVLSILRSAFQAVIREGLAADGVDLPAAAAGKRFASSGAEIVRAFVSLESGVHCSYPGVQGFASDYDPRKRPKYLLAANQRGIRWGNPYRDPFGHGGMLPASAALYAANDQFLGVAGVVTTFESIRTDLLSLPGHAAVTETLLVDDEARVVVRSSDTSADPGSTPGETPTTDLDSEGAIELHPLELPAVRSAILEHRSGHIEPDEAGPQRIVVFYPLSSLGWYYVVVADSAKIREAALNRASRSTSVADAATSRVLLEIAREP
jgi:eukaryotic-like serine/threonine-protein kinase